MSKFKKLISLLLMLMLALSVTLSFASCGDGDDGGDGGDGGSSDTGNGGNTGDTGNGGNTGDTGSGGGTPGDDEGNTPAEPIPTPPAAQIIKTYTVKVVDQAGNAVPGVTVRLVEYDEDGVQKGEKQGTTATVDNAAVATFSVVESAYLKAQVVSVPKGYVMGTYADGKTTLKYDTKVDFANYEATLTVVKPTGYIITAADADGNVFKGVEITYVVTPNDPATPENEEVKITVVTDSLGQAVLDLPALGVDDDPDTPDVDETVKIPVSFKYESETHVVEYATGEFGADQYQNVLIGPAVGTVPEKPEAIDALDKISLKVGETRYYTLTAEAGQSIIIRNDTVSVAYGDESFSVDAGAGVAIVPLTAGEAAFSVTNVGTSPITDAVTELVTVKTFAKPSDNTLEAAIEKGKSAWYEIDYKAGQYVIIDVGCDTAEVVYREHRYTPKNQKIEFQLNENGETAVFKVIAGAGDADALAANVSVKLITPINDETDIEIPAGESIWVSIAYTAGQYLLIDDATVTAEGYTFGETLGAAAGTKYIKLTATGAAETAIKPVTPLTFNEGTATVTVRGGKTAWFEVSGAGKYVFIENADAILGGIGEDVTAISGIIAAATSDSDTVFSLTVGDENTDLVIKLVDVTETEVLPTAPAATKGTTWYKVPADAGSYIFLLDETGKAQITYKGSTVNTANGVISVPVTDEDGYVIFALSFTATVADKSASEFSIATIETLAKTEATVPVEANGSVWFVYTSKAGEIILVEGATAVEINGVDARYENGKIIFAADDDTAKTKGTGTAYIKVTVGDTAGDVTLKPVTVLNTAELLDTTKGVKVNVPADGSARWLQIDYTAAGTLTIDSTKVIVYLDGATEPVAVEDDAKTVTVELPALAAGVTKGTLLIKVTSEESAEFTATFTIVAAPAVDETPAT